MSKLFILLVVGALVALIATGVIEVKLHPKKITDIPRQATSLIKNKSAFEKARAYLVGLKRRGEQFIIQDKEKRLELALLYVKKDAARLNDLIKNEQAAASLLPAADTLINSLDQVRVNAEKAPVDVVASLKKDSQQAFTSAQKALGNLKELHEEYETIHEEFTRLTKALEQQIGELELENQTEEDSPEAMGEANSSKIPLKF